MKNINNIKNDDKKISTFSLEDFNQKISNLEFTDDKKLSLSDFKLSLFKEYYLKEYLKLKDLYTGENLLLVCKKLILDLREIIYKAPDRVSNDKLIEIKNQLNFIRNDIQKYNDFLIDIIDNYHPLDIKKIVEPIDLVQLRSLREKINS